MKGRQRKAKEVLQAGKGCPNVGFESDSRFDRGEGFSENISSPVYCTKEIRHRPEGSATDLLKQKGWPSSFINTTSQLGHLKIR